MPLRKTHRKILTCTIGYILSVAFSPDGQSVLSAANDKTLLVRDVTTGRILHRFEGYVGSVLSVAFSPDGQSILARSGDNVLILWDVETGDIRRRFEGPRGCYALSRLKIIKYLRRSEQINPLPRMQDSMKIGKCLISKALSRSILI